MNLPPRSADLYRTYGATIGRTPGYRGLSPFYSAVVDGAEEALAAQGAHLLVACVDSAEESRDTVLRWAERDTVRGVLINDLVADDPRVSDLGALDLPVTVLGEYPWDGATTIDVDNDGAVKLAVTYLVGLGHRRIARVSGPPELFHTRTRTAAFARHTAAAGLTAVTIEGDYSAESGEQALRELHHQDRGVTAVVFDNDVMAVAALHAAQQLGIDVPGSLSLLAWDDSPWCQLARPALSVVSRDLHALGATIAAALLDPVPTRVVRAPGALVVPRGSTAPVGAGGSGAGTGER